MRIFLPVLICAILFFACSGEDNNVDPLDNNDTTDTSDTTAKDTLDDYYNDEYMIYKILVDSVIYHGYGSIIVLRDSTFTDEYARDFDDVYWFFEDSEYIDSQAVNQYVILNKKMHEIYEDSLLFDRTTFLIDKKECRSLINADGYELDYSEFYSKYPNAIGFIQVSKVGFNDTRDVAIAYCDYASGSMTGAGFLTLLVKREGGWTVKKIAGLWIV